MSSTIEELARRREAARLGGGENFVGHFALFGYKADNLVTALVERPKIVKAVVKCAQNFVVQRAGHFFSVTRDKRDCIALIEQFYCVFRLLLFYV